MARTLDEESAVAITLSKMDRRHLGWLAKQHAPMWGGHLKRGEPISDPDMGRWIETGLIEAVDTEGYRITDAGRAALGE
jgi:hypothetical protein